MDKDQAISRIRAIIAENAGSYKSARDIAELIVADLEKKGVKFSSPIGTGEPK